MIAAAPALLAGAVPAAAQWGTENALARPGFAFPADRPVRIVMFRPDVQVGAQSTGGIDQPDADWTATARVNIARALADAWSAPAMRLIDMPDPADAADAALLADYRTLFRIVVRTVFEARLFAGNRLPTKEARFDWTLGPGMARLGALGGGDYGLFVYSYDSYGSRGRKAAQIVGLMTGVGLTSGTHVGYAGLVDLTTGDLVWINADVSMGGDVRRADGAARRVAQLLQGFPTRAGLAP